MLTSRTVYFNISREIVEEVDVEQTWNDSKSEEEGVIFESDSRSAIWIFVWLDKILQQPDSFVYMGGAVCGGDGWVTEIHRNVWGEG